MPGAHREGSPGSGAAQRALGEAQGRRRRLLRQENGFRCHVVSRRERQQTPQRQESRQESRRKACRKACRKARRKAGGLRQGGRPQAFRHRGNSPTAGENLRFGEAGGGNRGDERGGNRGAQGGKRAAYEGKRVPQGQKGNFPQGSLSGDARQAGGGSGGGACRP